jgi:hypothetical protein
VLQVLEQIGNVRAVLQTRIELEVQLGRVAQLQMAADFLF